MTPGKRNELTSKLNEHGLSVLLTRDYDSLLLQLAHLAQFERLMIQIAEINPAAAGMVAEIRSEQKRFTDHPGWARPLEILDIPTILNQVSRALHAALDAGQAIRPEQLATATAVFIRTLSQEG